MAEIQFSVFIPVQTKSDGSISPLLVSESGMEFQPVFCCSEDVGPRGAQYVKSITTTECTILVAEDELKLHEVLGGLLVEHVAFDPLVGEPPKNLWKTKDLLAWLASRVN